MTAAEQATRLYDSDECRRLFKEAYERFPDYNTEGADDATDWILDELLLLQVDEVPQEVRDRLYEMIFAGLT